MTAVNPTTVLFAMMRRAHDLGLVHYQPTGAAPKNLSVPLATLGGLPNTVCAAAFAIYNVGVEHDDQLEVTNPLVFIQCRFREPGNDGGIAVANRAHAFFEGMHSETPGLWPGGVAPLWCLRTVVGEAQFDNGNWSRPDSYEIRYNTGE